MGQELDPRDERQLPVVTRWLDLTSWLLATTARMPRQWRHSLVNRLDEEVLQVLLLLTEAAYRCRKAAILREVNQRMNRLRMLLEVAKRVTALSTGAHEHALVAVDEVGRMVGGWLKEALAREEGVGSRARPQGPAAN